MPIRSSARASSSGRLVARIRYLGRPWIAAVEDVAAAVRYLVGSTLVTGSIMPVDGGFTVA